MYNKLGAAAARTAVATVVAQVEDAAVKIGNSPSMLGLPVSIVPALDAWDTSPPSPPRTGNKHLRKLVAQKQTGASRRSERDSGIHGRLSCMLWTALKTSTCRRILTFGKVCLESLDRGPVVVAFDRKMRRRSHSFLLPIMTWSSALR